MIIDQLNTLGQLDSGAWPLLIIIDNAAAAVRGTTVSRNLLELRETLEHAYKEGNKDG